MNAARPMHLSLVRAPETRAAHPPLAVLVLDDVAFDRRRIIRGCEKAGVRATFTEAASIADFDRALADRPYDLAFIDYRLPDGDGLMALEHLRAEPAQGECAAIMVAGDIDTAVAVEALKGGCSDYLGKNEIGPATLQRVVSGAVEKARLRRQNSAAVVMLEALHETLGRLAEVAAGPAREDLDALVACGGQSAPAAAWRLRDYLDEIAAYVVPRPH